MGRRSQQTMTGQSFEQRVSNAKRAQDTRIQMALHEEAAKEAVLLAALKAQAQSQDGRVIRGDAAKGCYPSVKASVQGS